MAGKIRLHSSPGCGILIVDTSGEQVDADTCSAVGNSLAVRIPKAFAREAQIAAGSAVDISVVDGKLVVERAAAPHYSLDELLAGITDDLHGEWHTGPAVGAEEW